MEDRYTVPVTYLRSSGGRQTKPTNTSLQSLPAPSSLMVIYHLVQTVNCTRGRQFKKQTKKGRSSVKSGYKFKTAQDELRQGQFFNIE